MNGLFRTSGLFIEIANANIRQTIIWFLNRAFLLRKRKWHRRVHEITTSYLTHEIDEGHHMIALHYEPYLFILIKGLLLFGIHRLKLCRLKLKGFLIFIQSERGQAIVQITMSLNWAVLILPSERRAKIGLYH